MDKEFDFDYWLKLASEDPERFERERRAALTNVIEESPERIKPRLNGLQWQLDQVRERSDNPMGACMRMYKMMWDSVLADDGLLDTLQRLSNPAQATQRERVATVLPFSRPGDETTDP